MASLLKGGGLRGGRALALSPARPLARPPAFDRRAAFFEGASRPAGCGRGGGRARLGLARDLRVQARRVFPRPVVAVRARAAKPLVPPCLGGSQAVVLAVRVGAADGPAPPGALAPARRSRRRRTPPSSAQSSTSPVPRLPARQGAALRRGEGGLPDVRRERADLGRARRPGGAGREAARPHPGLFLERCDDSRGVPIFYQVGKETLHLYADFGLTFVKLGEEARVLLSGFSLEGAEGKPFRNALRRLEREGGTFRMLSREEVAEHWRAPGASPTIGSPAAAGPEKGFSLGFFDPGYVLRFPVAVIEQRGEDHCVRDVWPGPGQSEISVDLMRYLRRAPKHVMEASSCTYAVGSGAGLPVVPPGMAPLSGFEGSPLAPLWPRLGRFVYRRGEAFYNFQGLRAFKDKFHPAGSRATWPIPAGFPFPADGGHLGPHGWGIYEDLPMRLGTVRALAGLPGSALVVSCRIPAGGAGAAPGPPAWPNSRSRPSRRDVYAPPGVPRGCALHLRRWGLEPGCHPDGAAASGRRSAGRGHRHQAFWEFERRALRVPRGTLEELSRAVHSGTGYPSTRRRSSSATPRERPSSTRCSPRPRPRPSAGRQPRLLPRPGDAHAAVPLRGLFAARAKHGMGPRPVQGLGVPWMVLHGDNDQVARRRWPPTSSAARIRPHRVAAQGRARLRRTPRWAPQYVEAYHRLEGGRHRRRPSPPRAPPRQVDDLGPLGLVEVPATGRERDAMAVVLTGDGGWAEIDKRSPPASGRRHSGRWLEQPELLLGAADPGGRGAHLARILEHYGRPWEKRACSSSATRSVPTCCRFS